MSNPGTDRADTQHPWIGLASFTEGDRSFFAGRGGEIEDLLRLVRRDTLTLLYGVSGLGKTSLVQAGLFPALRDENVLPVPDSARLPGRGAPARATDPRRHRHGGRRSPGRSAAASA